MKSVSEWRSYRNYLSSLACTVNVYSKEYRNINRRIRWINDNRLAWRCNK